ncbi:MAG: bifunctional aspartate kinase/homoserine dehydrogenase I [Balneolaceae bacterium]
MRVLKFGGSSVGSPEAIRKVVEIIKDKESRGSVTVVVSAFQGVTDLLSEAAKEASTGSDQYQDVIRNLESRHVDAMKELLKVQKQSEGLTQFKLALNELEDVLQGVSLIREITRRTLDFIMGFGERFSAIVLSQCLKEAGIKAEFVDARKLIKTDATFGQARVLTAPTYENIRSGLSDENVVYVVTGFVSSTRDNVSTTLGRGGSDYTASLIGAALQVDEIELWTDVDGLMTADPRKVKRAFPIREVSYEEAMELSHFGAKVIYPPTIQPALQAGIPISIKNTFQPENEGTVIRKEITESDSLIKGISSIDEIALITIKGSGMIGVSGVAARLFSTLAKKQINIILITQASSEHTVTLAVLPRHSAEARQAIEEEFHLELQEQLIDEIQVEQDLSVIAIVGDNMRQIPGIAGRVFSALGRNGVNIVAIAQGSSERNISFVVSKKDESKAMNALHDAFFLAGVKTMNLFLVGVGLIGSTLLDIFHNQVESLYRDYLIRIRLRGVANSKKMLIDGESIEIGDWKKELETRGKKTALTDFVKEMKNLNFPNSVFIDCTASDEVPTYYPEVLKSSISVVTPNKKANSSSQEYFKELHDLALRHNVAFRYETNVGAGLPVVATIHELVTTGDKLHRVEAVLSGTLSYIFNSFDGQTPFSAIVKQAREKGFTEPDPREDLNGHDVGRKLLILAREAGFELEFEDLDIQDLVPEGAKGAGDVASFFKKLEQYDNEFEKLRADAESKGKKLCYIARFENGAGIVKLEEIGTDHPFYGLSGSDNIVALYTSHYQESPMVVKGPGAGANVTAGGIVADILRVANTKAQSNAG